MSITVQERPTSRELTNDTTRQNMAVVREYWALSTNLQEDVLDINDAVALASPDVYLGFIKHRIQSTPLGGGLWHVTVNYKTLDGREFEATNPGGTYQLDDPLGMELSFSTSGATQHITKSLQTLGSYAAAGNVAPETNQAIGVSKSGVQGCDVVVNKFELTITRKVRILTMRYIHKLVDCTGCINFDPWNTFAPFELLFLGCEGTPQETTGAIKTWLLTYKFQVGKHQKNLKIGGPSTINIIGGANGIPLKFAHDYLWVGYKDSVDLVAGVALQVPYFAKIEVVYDNRVFAQWLEF